MTLCLYSVIYLILTYYLITSGIAEFNIIAFGGICLLSIFVIHKKYRSIYSIIFISGIVFLTVGEVYFRLNYFGLDGIRHFQRYIPTDAGDPLTYANIEHDNNSFTGLKTGSTGILKGKTFYVNNLGFRDKDRSFIKDNNTVRIIVCGSSTSMGSGVEQGDAYAGHLERILNENNKDPLINYEVINLAIAGYGMDDVINVLSTFGMKFDPDIILIDAYGWGKTGFHKTQEFKGNKVDLIKIILHRPYSEFFFVGAIANEFMLRIKERVINVSISKIKNFFMFDYERKIYKEIPIVDTRQFIILQSMSNYLAPEETINYYLDQINKIVSEKRVFLVALRPMKFFNEKLGVSSELVKLSQKYGFGLVDTYNEDYGSNEKEAIIYVGDRHPNSKTHKIYAESIYKTIMPSIEQIIKSNNKTIPKDLAELK